MQLSMGKKKVITKNKSQNNLLTIVSLLSVDDGQQIVTYFWDLMMSIDGLLLFLGVVLSYFYVWSSPVFLNNSLPVVTRLKHKPAFLGNIWFLERNKWKWCFLGMRQ